jgi:hypothetical protein
VDREAEGPQGYEFQVGRAVAVAKYMVDNSWAAEDRVATAVVDQPRIPGEPAPKRRIEFVLTRKN